MMRVLLAALALASCGVPAVLPTPGKQPRYKLTAELVEDFGEPCSISGPEGGGLQVWRYCAGDCPPSYADLCVVACTPGCPAWEFQVLNGVILYTSGP